MDNIFFDEDLKKHFEKLPTEVQKVILSLNLSEIIQEISRRNKLMIDQEGGLQMETMLVILGLEPLDDFIKNIIKSTGIDEKIAIEISKDIDKEIFKVIRNSLIKITTESTIEEEAKNLKKEDIISGIENPQTTNEIPVSISSFESNSSTNKKPVTFSKGIEIGKEIYNEKEKRLSPTNLPLNNILEAKINEIVVIPKREIIIEEKTKIPQKIVSEDPYREQI